MMSIDSSRSHLRATWTRSSSKKRSSHKQAAPSRSKTSSWHSRRRRAKWRRPRPRWPTSPRSSPLLRAQTPLKSSNSRNRSQSRLNNNSNRMVSWPQRPHKTTTTPKTVHKRRAKSAVCARRLSMLWRRSRPTRRSIIRRASNALAAIVLSSKPILTILSWVQLYYVFIFFVFLFIFATDYYYFP